MSDLKEGLDRDRYYKNNPIEGQKDVLPELLLIEKDIEAELKNAGTYNSNLAAELSCRERQFLAHIRSTREEIQRLRVGISLVCELHGCASETCTAAQYHEDAQKMIRRVEISEEKMKRAVEVLKQDNRCLSQKQVDAAIKILSPDTESDNKSVTK